jgi:hypothetical protein
VVYSWPAAIPSLLLIGIFLGAVVVGTGSLRAAIWLHASVNATALLFMVAVRYGVIPPTGGSDNVAGWVLATAAAGLTFDAVMRVLWRRGAIADGSNGHTIGHHGVARYGAWPP